MRCERARGRRREAIRGMRESILEGMATDVKDLSSDPGW